MATESKDCPNCGTRIHVDETCPRCAIKPFAPPHGSVAATICLHCDYWTQRTADTTGGMQGWCDLFVKRTAADHGRQCTGWTPREPLNNRTERPAGNAGGSQPKETNGN